MSMFRIYTKRCDHFCLYMFGGCLIFMFFCDDLLYLLEGEVIFLIEETAEGGEG
jgi:hypothetical protein